MSLGASLLRQVHGDTFDYLFSQIGEDLRGQIPEITLSNDIQDHRENYYVQPWRKPKALPADAVIGVFPNTKRPFITLRYVDARTNELVAETFSQKYCSFMQGHMSGDPKKIWTSTNPNNLRPIAKMASEVDKQQFEVLKSILQGENLEKTEDRYLPLYKDKFIKV